MSEGEGKTMSEGEGKRPKKGAENPTPKKERPSGSLPEHIALPPEGPQDAEGVGRTAGHMTREVDVADEIPTDTNTSAPQVDTNKIPKPPSAKAKAVRERLMGLSKEINSRGQARISQNEAIALGNSYATGQVEESYVQTVIRALEAPDDADMGQTIVDVDLVQKNRFDRLPAGVSAEAARNVQRTVSRAMSGIRSKPEIDAVPAPPTPAEQKPRPRPVTNVRERPIRPARETSRIIQPPKGGAGSPPVPAPELVEPAKAEPKTWTYYLNPRNWLKR